MPGRTPPPPLTVTVVAALWVSLSRCGVSGSPGPGCDNGKLFLDRDLPADAVYRDCSGSPLSTQRRPSVDKVYDPAPAMQICMDEYISYNHTIPNSGAYRPVKAESGEYVYCPPQRWLNNLHHGATVVLYHPCAPPHDLQVLSVLAHSCLSDYILTPHPQLSHHMPIALVSWGRTLELSTVASSDICEWLEKTTSTTTIGNEFRSVTGRKYNLLLTWPAKKHQLQRAQYDRSTRVKESLRECCEQTVSSLLNEVMEAKLETSMKKESLKKTKGRQIRAAISEIKEAVKEGNKRDKQNNVIISRAGGVNYNSTPGPLEDSPLGNRPLPDHPGTREDVSESMNLNLDQSLTTRTVNHLLSNMYTTRSDSSAFGASESQKTTQASALQPSSKHTDTKNTDPNADSDDFTDEYNHTARLQVPTLSSKVEGTDAAKQSMNENNSQEKNSAQVLRADGKMKDNEVVDVKERELEPKQTYSHHKNENSGFDSISKSNTASEHQVQTAVYLPNSHDCEGCKPGQQCDCTKASGTDVRAAIVNNGLPRTPRTDEAVWAAGALGFLLVLLTLSVLHTRLYRHWRTTPSLYWRDPRQDYDSVADVIRRRLRIAKRRGRRSRRKECVLLPSSSSSDEFP